MRIHQTRTQIEAEMAVSRLEAAGLHPAEVSPWPHVTFAGADLGFWVEVPPEEAEAARQMLKENGAPGPVQGHTGSLSTWVKLAVVAVIIVIAAGMLLP